MKKVIIDKELLKNLIYRSHCYCAVVDSGIFAEADVKPKELDLIFLNYAVDSGVGLPDNVTGTEALDILSEWDMDFFYEVETYDNEREND